MTNEPISRSELEACTCGMPAGYHLRDCDIFLGEDPYDPRDEE